jgi:hypothetical protein
MWHNRQFLPFLTRASVPNMKSFISKAGLAGLAMSALIPASAKALDETYNFDYYCVGSGALQACASVRIQSNGNTLTMQVWNLNGTMGGQHTMTAIGLYHAHSDWTGTVNSYSVDYYPNAGSPQPINTNQYWTAKKSTDVANLAGVKAELAEGNVSNSGIIGCTNPGGGGTKWQTCTNGQSSFPNAAYVKFTFGLSNHFSLQDLELRWHSQQLVNGQSVKCDTGGAGDYPDCDGTFLAPEPGSLVLMLSGLGGLAGVAVVGRRRRRRIENI